MIAVTGKGPDVSHIGSTWVSSLVMLNALRPFSADEFERLGGKDAFVPASQTSIRIEKDARLWSVPWNIYSYVILYRQDLLRQIGVDPGKAFVSPSTLLETIYKLQQSDLISNPWLLPTFPPPYSDLLHIAASWIWSQHGSFLGVRGRRVAFDQPAALEGWKAYFRAHQVSSTNVVPATAREYINVFTEGRTGITVTDTQFMLSSLQNQTETSAVRAMGVAPLFESPWCGGGNLVIWQHALADPEKVKASLELVRFLTDKKTLVRLSRDAYIVPARVEALEALFPKGHRFYTVLESLRDKGRSYRSLRSWQQIEYHLASLVGELVTYALKNRQMKLDSVISERMTALADQLNRTLM